MSHFILLTKTSGSTQGYFLPTAAQNRNKGNSFIFVSLEIILPMHQLAHFGPASRLKSLSPPCFNGGVETVVFFIRIAGINVIKARINIMIRCALM